jgi:hypothetical protein
MQGSATVILQVQVEISALDVWLAYRSDLMDNEDPWYMRFNLQGLLLNQVREISMWFSLISLIFS